MRPIRRTGITGTDVTIPLDAYCISPAAVCLETAGTTASVQITNDNVFDASITPAWQTVISNTSGAGATSNLNQVVTLPLGTRGVRGVGMASADVLAVSQQSVT